MHDLEITWPGGQARFSPDDSPVTVGRSPDAAVILTDPSVSRRHIEFVWNGTAWTASDSSTHGSFDPIGVRLAPTWTVGTDTTVRLGGVEGVELRIELLTTPPPGIHDPLVAPPPVVEVEAPPRPPSLEDFVVPGAGQGPIRSTPILAPDPVPAPSLLNAAPPVPAGFGAPPPPPAPPSAFDAAPPPAPPAGFDSAPPPAPPSAFDAAPPAPPAGFDAPPPPAPSAGFDAAPPPAPPSAFDAAPPAPPAGFDAAPPAPPAGFDAAPPPAPPSAFDAAPPAPPAGFDAPPASPAGFDAAPPPAPYRAPAWDDPGASRNGAQPPAPGWTGDGGADNGWAPAATSVHHLASTTQVGESTISLSIDDRDFTFLPGTEITVGRDPSCLVTVDERHSLVSRRHLTITHHDGAWWIQDTSTKGTYIDGRKISGPTRAEGAFLAQLGDDDAGVALRIITAGEHRVRRQRNVPLLVAIGVLAVVALGALALALQNRGGGQPLAAGDSPFGTGPVATAAPGTDAAAVLAQAKQSTVMLLADQGLGSGFFVSDKLIVTNQHVAALAPTLLVAVSRDVDKPAQIEYEATTIALHPFLDIAVLQITGDANGNPVDSVGLPPVKLGDSNTLTLGDPVFNTGFPAEFAVISLDDMGELRLPPVSATRGEAASWAIWPGCSNPDQASFIPEGSPPGVGCSPDGDITNAVVITTFASGQGASGSPVFHNDEVVAVVFAGPQDEANAGRNISTAAFETWLQQTITDNS